VAFYSVLYRDVRFDVDASYITNLQLPQVIGLMDDWAWYGQHALLRKQEDAAAAEPTIRAAKLEPWIR
jgi:hypothetical protein